MYKYCVVLVAVLLQASSLVDGCFDNVVHLAAGVSIGTHDLNSRRLLATMSNGTEPEAELENEFNYAKSGLDWNTDPTWVCLTGKRQSPINIPTELEGGTLTEKDRSTFNFGQGKDVYLINNGRTIQVEWKPTGRPASATVIVRDGRLLGRFDPMRSDGRAQRVPITPRQFHFHSSSEHAIAGRTFALELHIVSTIDRSVLPSCPADGCIVVTGIVFKYDRYADDDDNPFLAGFFDRLPNTVAAKKLEGYKLDLNMVLPNSRSYYTYPGSLTVPGCKEGVLWQLFEHPVQLSSKQVIQFENAMAAISNPCKLGKDAKTPGCSIKGARTTNRPIQPNNGRAIQYYR